MYPSDTSSEYDEALEKILQRFPGGWGAYVGVGPGWFPLITELDARLAEIKPDYEVHQVKEKFGGLRYYIGSGSEEMHQLIQEAEERSYKICEETGKPGRLVYRNSWMKTLNTEDYPDSDTVRPVDF